MPARIRAPEPWHRRPVCKGTGAGPPRPPSPPGRLPQCESWRLTPALRPRRLPGAGPLSCPGPAPLRPLSLPRPCHHPGHHRCLCADLRPLGGPHPVCLPGPSCPSGSSGRARPCPSPGLVAPCTFERGLGLPAPFLHLLEGSGAHSSPWGLLISPRKEMGQATRERPPDAAATAGLPSELPESAGWQCPSLPGPASRGESPVSRGLPVCLQPSLEVAVPPPHCQAGLGLNRSPRLACGLRAGPRRLPSVPRLPYWAEGAGEDQAGLARCSKPRPDNPPKCCPAAKQLYFRPLSAKAGSVSSSSWFNPSGWGRTLWQEEGTWKPLVTGLP